MGLMESNNQQRPVRVGLISLGCAKNLVDAELMLGNLLRNGIEITNDPAQADAVIVNTCSFIDSAQEESVDAILESAELRQARNRGQGLIVSGCLPQRFRDDLPTLFPEVDAFMGIDQVTQVSDIVRSALERRTMKLQAEASGHLKGTAKGRKTRISKALSKEVGAAAESDSATNLRGTAKFGSTKVVVGSPSDAWKSLRPLIDVNLRPKYIPDYNAPRLRLTPRHFAYLKIAEGCNHPCSFCIIPRMRGAHRSRPQADVVAEAKALLADGVKEINLISQDSTYYGMDLRPNHSRAIASPDRFAEAARMLPSGGTSICSLLRELNELPGDFWIRLLYTHPAHWTDELIQTIAVCPKVARYVDIPLQHIHENMLERMRRETSRQYIVDLLNRIRAGVPGIALRTTFIVGFPGETQAAFDSLIGFIRETRFERLGIFAYSREEGTRAGSMAGQLSDKVKQQRREIAMAAQHEVAALVSGSFVGKTLRVLTEHQATAEDLKRARIHSWEHGLMRGGDEHMPVLKGVYTVARCESDAPDIDGRVYLRGAHPIGQFLRAKVMGHTDYDLIAQATGSR